ncbi:hypothetical protein TW95_gp0114 [Pandoravirus inopinatum]|uniref:DUF5860 domain-containing protein n=1 Tax=Pandoravirus inopinatum TaxID=1605721 RepID=A0A0B5IW04_9VIRU|nr:hypothetical protein TW95_gp0114 [Pandoravirus inopinatum]AJF96848.1 hypothetical protein [Pandoravirus inopinatum]
MDKMTTATDPEDLAQLYPRLDAEGVGWLKAIAAALDGRTPYMWVPTSAGLQWSVLLSDDVPQCAIFITKAYALVAADDRPWCVRMAIDDHDPRRLRFGVFVRRGHDAAPSSSIPPLDGTETLAPTTVGPVAGTPVVTAQTVDDIGRLYPWLSAADLVKASALHDALAVVPHAWATHVPDGPFVNAEPFSNRGVDEMAAVVRQRQCEWPPSCRSQPVILALDISVGHICGRQQTDLLFAPATEAPLDRCVLGQGDGIHLGRMYPFLGADDLKALEALDAAIVGVPHRWVVSTHPEPASGSRPIAIDTKVAGEWLGIVCREATTDLGRPCRVVLGVRDATGAVRYWTEPIGDRKTNYVDNIADDKCKHVDGKADPIDSESELTTTTDRCSSNVNNIAMPAGFETLARLPVKGGGEVAWLCALAHGLGSVPIAWTRTRSATDIVLHMSTPAESAAMVVGATYHRGRNANTESARAVLGIDSDAAGGPLFFYRIETDTQTD